MTAQLDGPRIAPAADGPARQLVVLLHGYGADGNDLIALGQQWAGLLPHAAFVAPNAPDRCAGSPFGYQWFPLQRLDPHEFATGVQTATPLLNGFIDAELAVLGLGAASLALVGFSQGTMLALQVGLRREPGPVAIVGYSGALAAPERLNGEITARPPVLLIHGDADEVIPVVALHHAAAGLGAAEVPVEWHVTQGLGHGIDADGLAMAGRFLAERFAEAAA